MTTLLSIIRDDSEILLERAFLGKTLFMFGEDGNGQYGRNEFPVYATVRGVAVSMTAEDEDNPSDIHAVAYFMLDGYDSTVTGHAITDHNLRISLNMLLKDAAIDVTSLDWADVSIQDDHTIALSIDTGKLLDWA